MSTFPWDDRHIFVAKTKLYDQANSHDFSYVHGCFQSVKSYLHIKGAPPDKAYTAQKLSLFI
jgi:hypothetical protein